VTNIFLTTKNRFLAGEIINYKNMQIKTGIYHKLPINVWWYIIAKIFLFVFLIFLFFVLISAIAFFPLVLFLSFLLLLTSFLSYRFISFIIEEGKITKRSGIFIKNSKTVYFKNIQNIETKSGPLMKLFHIVEFKIWTASPGQKDKNQKERPDIALGLLTESVDWLNNYILSYKTDD